MAEVHFRLPPIHRTLHAAFHQEGEWLIDVRRPKQPNPFTASRL